MKTTVKCPQWGRKSKVTFVEYGTDVDNYATPKVPLCRCGMPVGPGDIVQPRRLLRRAVGWGWRIADGFWVESNLLLEE